jgi:hypothetical protein
MLLAVVRSSLRIIHPIVRLLSANGRHIEAVGRQMAAQSSVPRKHAKDIANYEEALAQTGER